MSPSASRTVLLYGLDDGGAIAALSRALNSSHEVSAAAHLPAAVAARSSVDFVRDSGRAVTAIRVEGPGPSVEHRCEALRRDLQDTGPSEELHSMRSSLLWRALRDAAPLLPDPACLIWRVSVPPAAGAQVVREIASARGAASQPVEYYFDWAGGLIWLALPPSNDASAAIIRATVARHGGHATLLRAPVTTRLAVPVFEPQPAPLAALARRVKDAFDPRRVLNPGRMASDL